MESIPVRHLPANKKEPDLFENFSIRDIQTMLGGNDMAQELHRHDFYYVLVIRKGEGQHDIDFHQHTFGEQIVYFMRPGQVHQLLLYAESTGYLMQFSTDFYLPKDKTANALLRQAGSQNHYQLNADSFQNIESVLANVFREYTNKKDRYEEVIQANMDIFFIELTRQQNNRVPAGTSLYTQERLDNFMELLEVHIFTHKQVVQYAEMLNISTYQLNTVIKTALGKTCSELINEHIILEAKRCLLATSSQINQTAYRLGYEDVSYFIRFFKKHTSYSPEAFRNKFR